MEKDIQKEPCKNTEATDFEITEKQIEVLARRMLPEIKKFFTDEKVRLEFKEWQAKQQDKKIKWG